MDNKSVDVAFKMTKSSADDAGEVAKKQLKSLLAELKVMIHIGTHPNIIQLVGAYTRQLRDGLVYVALEFCMKGNLEQLLRRSKHVGSSDQQTHDRLVKPKFLGIQWKNASFGFCRGLRPGKGELKTINE